MLADQDQAHMMEHRVMNTLVLVFEGISNILERQRATSCLSDIIFDRLERTHAANGVWLACGQWKIAFFLEIVVYATSNLQYLQYASHKEHV